MESSSQRTKYILYLAFREINVESSNRNVYGPYLGKVRDSTFISVPGLQQYLMVTLVTPSPKHRPQRRRPTNDLPGHYPFWGSRPPEAPPPWPPPLQSRQLLDSIVPFITVDIIDLLYLPSSHLPQQPYRAFSPFLSPSHTSSRITFPYYAIN